MEQAKTQFIAILCFEDGAVEEQIISQAGDLLDVERNMHFHRFRRGEEDFSTRHELRHFFYHELSIHERGEPRNRYGKRLSRQNTYEEPKFCD